MYVLRRSVLHHCGCIGKKELHPATNKPSTNPLVKSNQRPSLWVLTVDGQRRRGVPVGAAATLAGTTPLTTPAGKMAHNHASGHFYITVALLACYE
jgi:hypothetical protein